MSDLLFIIPFSLGLGVLLALLVAFLVGFADAPFEQFSNLMDRAAESGERLRDRMRR